MRPNQLTLLLALCCLSAGPLSAQSVTMGMPGAETTVTADPGPRHWIVLYEAEPLARAGLRSKAAADRIESLHRTLASAAGPDRIRHRYAVVLAGAAITATRSEAEALLRLPGIRAIHPDVEMRAADAVSVAHTRAPEYRTRTGATGTGVVVAVIDTGVDYLHPRLGGGFGAGFKVMGGWDFVDDDADPMDFNGHGTHVAGIVAGSAGAGMEGVAPGARLLAYRTLGTDGRGLTSWTIAALERAVVDGADVVNLSLGATGTPDDPSSQAADAASQAGVVVVAAAGNESQHYRIGSPGAAREAITVAATDNQDRIAPFSSRGPASVTFGNKPDLAAPGVDILSSLPGGAYGRLSGTSMATPHVAGLVALLVQRYSNATPAQIKALLMQGSVDVGLGIWVAGAGRVDIERADTQPFLVTPATVSLGNVEADGTQTHTFTVTNLSGSARTFSHVVEEALPGLSVTVSPASRFISPGASGTFTATFTLTAAALPLSNDLRTPHRGLIRFQYPNASVVVPFTAVRTPQLVLDFDVAPSNVLVFNTGSLVDAVEGPGNRVSVPLSAGTYDVVAQYLEFPTANSVKAGFLIRERVSVSNRTTLALSTAELTNEVNFALKDLNGDTLSPDMGFYSMRHVSGFRFSMMGFRLERLAFSDFDNRFRFDLSLHEPVHTSGIPHIYTYGFGAGIREPITLADGPAQLLPVTYRFHPPAGTTTLLVAPEVYDMVPIGTFSNGHIIPGENAGYRLQAPFERTYAYRRVPETDATLRYHGVAVYDLTHNPQGDLLTMSALLRPHPSGMEYTQYFEPEAPFRTESGPSTYDLGTGTLAFTGRMRNFTGNVRFDQTVRRALFTYPQGDLPVRRVQWDLRDRNDLTVQADTLVNDILAKLVPWSFPQGPGSMHLEMTDAWTDHWQAHARVELGFDLDRLEDPNPPHIRALAWDPATRTLSADLRDKRLHPDQDGTVATSELRVRPVGTTDWLPLPTDPDAWAAGYHDLQVRATDAAGNTLSYILEPAFRVGDLPAGLPDLTPVALFAPEDGSGFDPATYGPLLGFTWTGGDGTDVRFRVHVRGPGLDTTLVTTGTHATLPTTHLRPGSTYTWDVLATDGWNGRRSGTGTFRTTTSTSIEDSGQGTEDRFILHAAYPNPFNPTTVISYSLRTSHHARLAVYDLLGREVAVLVDGRQAPGRHQITFDASALASGIYVVRLEADGQVRTRMVTLLK